MEISTFSKKLSILYILEILKKYSDEKHPLKQCEIVKKLKDYGIEFERKSIRRNIDDLIQAGYDIALPEEGGYYLRVRQFEEAELRFLLDSVTYCKIMPLKQKRDLIKRLLSDTSDYFRKDIIKSKLYSNIFSENYQFTAIIENINNAVKERKIIRVTFNDYTQNKIHTVNVIPYKLINAYGDYYLIYISYLKQNGNFIGHTFNINERTHTYLRYYKLENIKQVDILNKIFVYEEFKDLNFDDYILAKYGTENPDILPLKRENITLKARSCTLDNIYSSFGKDVIINEIKESSEDEYYKNEKYYKVFLKANGVFAIYWIKQHIEDIEVIEPLNLKKEYERILLDSSSRYKKKTNEKLYEIKRKTYLFAYKRYDGNYIYTPKNNINDLYVLKYMFDYAEDYSCGLGLVKKDNEYYYIDPDKKPVIKKGFQYAESFKNGYAVISFDGVNYGIIDTQGNIKASPDLTKENAYKAMSKLIQV